MSHVQLISARYIRRAQDTNSNTHTGGFLIMSHFLGFELDTIAMEVQLPQTKLLEIQSLMQSWMHKNSCLKKEL